MTKSISSTGNKFKPGIYNLKIQRLIIGQQKPTRNDYIKAFGKLPDFVLKANGILSSELNEGNLGVLLKSHRDAFDAMYRWIVHFDNTSNNSRPVDPPELRFSWESDYKPHAEESWALLNLCQEILKRDVFGWKDSIESLTPAELWFSCEFEKLEQAFQTTGILGLTTQIGKQQSCDTRLQQIKKNFDSLHSRKFGNASDFEQNQIQSWESTVEAIRTHAEKIAQSDMNFCHHIYGNYIKQQKRTLRSIRSNRNLQFSALGKENSLFIGGQGKRGKGQNPSKSKKGFCKEK